MECRALLKRAERGPQGGLPCTIVIREQALRRVAVPHATVELGLAMLVHLPQHAAALRAGECRRGAETVHVGHVTEVLPGLFLEMRIRRHGNLFGR